MSEKRKKKPTKATQVFIEEMATPGSNQTEAYQKAHPKASKETARRNASKLLTNTDISDRIEKRKAIVAKYANVSAAQVLGATALRAFATIDDAFDKDGHFDIKKARKTGAIHLIKKMSRSPNKYGETVTVEFYSNESAQDKLGNYLGMEQQPQANESDQWKSFIRLLVEQRLEPDVESAIAYAKSMPTPWNPPNPQVEQEVLRDLSGVEDLGKVG